MKVLFLVEDADCVKLLAKLPQVKVISEAEIVAESPYKNSVNKVGYSTYVVSRAESLSKIYKFSRPLAMVLHQSHQHAVERVQHDVSVRIVHSKAPRRLTDSPSYKCDHTFLTSNLTEAALRDIFEL
jgi:hypothetical protein